MRKIIIAAALALLSTVAAAEYTCATQYEREPSVVQCIQPVKHEPASGVAAYPAYLVSMVSVDGAQWTAYIDHQWSAFEQTPGSFLYAKLFDGDLPNQQELVGVLDECAKLAGAPCRMLGVDQISPNPRW